MADTSDSQSWECPARIATTADDRHRQGIHKELKARAAAKKMP